MRLNSIFANCTSNLIAFLIIQAFFTRSSRAQYYPGYVWNRQAVWNGGTGDGTTNGNPNLDSMDNPAWEYLALGGDGLGSSDPWYTAGPSMHSVLGSFDEGSNAWVGGNAFAFQDRFYHQHGASGAPAVAWLNPTDSPITVNISGQMQFAWEQGAPNPIDYVIATENLTTYAATPLLETTVFPSGSGYVPVNISDVPLSADEGLVFTYRAEGGSVGLYTGYDSINVTLVPEPATLSPLLIGGAGLLMRRRQRIRPI
jgi:hypothetical protein